MAAVGALLISSGIALMAAPTTASAAQFKNDDHKVVLCHGTSSEGNPYVGISVDKHATKAHEGHSHVWSGDTWWHGVFHQDGSVKLDVIPAPGATEDAQMAYCNAPAEEAPQATASVTAVQPTCANGNTASYTKEGTHVATWTQSAAPAPGTSITVTATAENGTTFSGGASTMVFPLTFEAAKTNCGAVSPPTSTTEVSPPKTKTKAKAETTTVSPTVVEAGLPGVGNDTGTDAGLALALAGLALLVGAGGLVLVEGGERK